MKLHGANKEQGPGNKILNKRAFHFLSFLFTRTQPIVKIKITLRITFQTTVGREAKLSI